MSTNQLDKSFDSPKLAPFSVKHGLAWHADGTAPQVIRSWALAFALALGLGLGPQTGAAERSITLFSQSDEVVAGSGDTGYQTKRLSTPTRSSIHSVTYGFDLVSVAPLVISDPIIRLYLGATCRNIWSGNSTWNRAQDWDGNYHLILSGSADDFNGMGVTGEWRLEVYNKGNIFVHAFPSVHANAEVPTVWVGPTAINVVAYLRTPLEPQTVTIENIYNWQQLGQRRDFTLSTDAGWVGLSPESGVVQDTVKIGVTLDTESLALGVHEATITLTSSNDPPFFQIIPVRVDKRKLVQTISDLPLGSQFVGDPPVVLNATASSGLPVSLSIESAGGQLVGNLFIPRTEGLVTIRASQPGDDLWAAVERTWSFPVVGTNFANINAALPEYPVGVAYGNGVFLAAAGGNVYRSTNGLRWTNLGPPPTPDTQVIRFGNGQFLLGQGFSTGFRVLISADGSSWQSAVSSSGGYSLSDMAAANGYAVAVGSQRSSDWPPKYYGYVWEQAPGGAWQLSTAPEFHCTAVAYGAGQCVVLSWSSLYGSAYCYSRPMGGSSWSRRYLGPTYPGALAYGNGVFVRTESGSIYSSTDGASSWTLRYQGNVIGLDFVGGRFIATGGTGLLVTSADGSAWTELPSLTAGDLTAAAYGDRKTVVVGSGGTVLVSYVYPTNAATAPVITSAGVTNGLVGVPFSHQITADNAPTLFGAIGLPAGLLLNETNGLIAGIATTAGVYRVTIAAANAGGATSVVLKLYVFDSPPTAPVVADDPRDASVWAGSTAELQVLAYGAEPLRYQWSRNGVALEGASQSTLRLTNIQPSQAGAYDVTVSNDYGTNTSAAAWVGVIVMPAITQQPADQRVIPGQTASFSVSATGPGTLGFQWLKDGQPLANGERFGGVLNSNLTINGVTLDDTAAFSVRVSNEYTNILSSAARLSSPSVVIWGNGAYTTNIPSRLTNVVAVAAGQTHLLALQPNGLVTAWGLSNGGQTNVPPDLSNVVSVAAGGSLYWAVEPAMGGSHSLALKRDGRVVAWGSNGHQETLVPSTLSNAVGIAATHGFSAAIQSDGKPLVWGNWTVGPPMVPAGQSNIMGIAVAEFHALAVRADGRVISWGVNWSPTNVPAGLSNVVAVAAGRSNSMALCADGRVFVWGASGDGQTNVPPSASNIVAIAASVSHFLALRSDGRVVAWGSGSSGQTDVPAEMHSVTAIAAGTELSVASIGTTAPFFPMRPKTIMAETNTTAYLRAEVTGRWPLYCQWKLDGQDLAGATNRILILTNLMAWQAGVYSVEASNALGVTTGQVASLIVRGPPVLVQQPPSQTNALGSTAVFGVIAKGATPLSYQWCKDGKALANSERVIGTTSNLLTIGSLEYTDVGNYSVIVSNALGVVTSAPPATLTVVAPRPPEFMTGSTRMQTDGSFRFDVISSPGSQLEIWTSSNLFDWYRLTTLTNTAGTMPFTNAAPGSRQQFYRLK